MIFQWMCSAPVFAEAPPSQAQVEQVLEAIDRNMTYQERTSQMRMTVVKGKRTKVYEMHSNGRGKHEAAIEFQSPARDKGTKMLKGENELWIYFPSIEKTQKISGHMLRQGMMGSDLSYEDLMHATELTTHYNAAITGTEVVENRDCYRIEMIAKTTGISYPKRISWIDVERLVPVKEEMYALSGMLLKIWTFSEVQQIEERWFPTKIEVVDKVKSSGITTLEFVEVDFSVTLEDELFSRRWLER